MAKNSPYNGTMAKQLIFKDIVIQFAKDESGSFL